MVFRGLDFIHGLGLFMLTFLMGSGEFVLGYSRGSWDAPGESCGWGGGEGPSLLIFLLPP